jgi:hypothetical protein
MATDNEGNIVPQQVLDAANEAEGLHAKMFGTETPAADPAVDPNADPAPAEAAPSDTTDPAPTEDPTPAPEPEAIDWEAKFKEKVTEYDTLTQQHKTLKGKYDKEVPANASRADQLENRLTAFKQEVMDRLGDPNAAHAQQRTEEPSQDTALVGDAKKFAEEYEGDYIEGLRAFMKQELSPLLRDTVKPVEEKVAAVEENQGNAAQEDFIKTVGENMTTPGEWVSDWTNQDSNPEFEAFLNAPDPSGLYTNGELAEIFNQNHDGVKFAKLMGQFYKAEEPAADPKPAPVADPAPAAQEPAAVATPDPADMIAPDTASAAAPTETGEKRIWTKESMDAFYEKDRKDGYTPEESTQLWNDLLMAEVEGRIQMHAITH